MTIATLVALALTLTPSVFASQVVYFNPPVGGVITCAIDYFSYRDSVLRLDTSACLGDRVFGNGFEGVADAGAGCIGGRCP